MKGDFSRDTFLPRKGYAGVLMQQGRVQIDADWNEQLAIQRHLDWTTYTDVIGHCGAPKRAPGFAVCVDDCADLRIGAGRFYVDGILCVNPQVCDYVAQPDYPSPPATRNALAQTGLGIVYLDVFHAHVTALEDPHIKEVALGGPDTATRMRTVWQVKILPITGDPNAAPADEDCGCAGSAPVSSGCDASYPEWDALVRKSPPTLNARTSPEPAETPCLLPPTAGYRRLENQLYRVEVHRGSASGGATFKWSRDNGIVVTAVTNLAGAVLTLGDLGRDQVLGFASGQWIELFDRRHELDGQPGTLLQIIDVDLAASTVTLATTPATGALDMTLGPRVRRWDQSGSGLGDGIAITGAGWLPLEDGVEVQFQTGGQYRTGDYWLVPARTATGEIDWPPFQTPNSGIAQPPAGVRHHYCRLAIVALQGTALKLLSDCRRVFAPLTECERVESDSKLHNRYLHGFGVVNGLKARCAGNGKVSVSKGYAIAPDGADLFVESATELDLVALAAPGGLLDAKKSGELQLTLGEGDSGPVFGVRKYAPEATFVAQILKGTLLQDAYEQCVKPFLDVLRAELAEPATTAPAAEAASLVGDPTRRRIALLNLFVQLSAKNGDHVFLSKEEHEHLEHVNDALKNALHSDTYCKLNAAEHGLSAFPAYPEELIGLGIETAFGKSQSNRLIVHATGAVAYAWGGQRKHQLYVHAIGAGTTELAEVISVGELGGEIVDVALYQNQVLVALRAAADANETDPATTTLVRYQRSASGHALGTTAKVAFNLKRLVAVEPGGKPRIFGFAAQNGVEIGTDLAATVIMSPPAGSSFGRHAHVVGTQSLTAVVLVKNEGSQALSLASYSIDAAGKTSGPWTRTLDHSLDDLDDMQLWLDEKDASGQELGVRVAIAYRSTTDDKKHVDLMLAPAANSNADYYDGSIEVIGSGPVQVLPLPDQELVLVSKAEGFAVTGYKVSDGYLVKNQGQKNISLPTQVFPTALALVPGDEQKVLVANRASNTLTVFDNLEPQEDSLKALVAYRAQLIAAFVELGVALLQDLKDAFCELLLPEAPVVEAGGVVALAHATLRLGVVQKVCNFPRDEVVTFPKLGHWLSALPILPALGYVLEQICCVVLPDFAADLRKRAVNVTGSRLVLSQELKSRMALRLEDAKGVAPSGAEPDLVEDQWVTYDFDALTNEVEARIELAQQHLHNWAAHQFHDATRPTPPAATYAFNESRLLLGSSELIGGSVATATRFLAAIGALVAGQAQPYEKSLDRNAIDDLVSTPLQFAQGDSVELYQQGSPVMLAVTGKSPNSSQAKKTAEGGTAERLPPAGNGSRSTSSARDVERLRSDVKKLTKKHQEALADRDTEISALKDSIAALSERLSVLGELEQTVAALKAAKKDA